MAATAKQLAALAKGRKTLKARRDRQAAALRGTTSKKAKRTTTMPKKRKKTGTGTKKTGAKKRRSGSAGGGSKSFLSLNKTDAVIALATIVGYGYLQHRAETAKGDEMKWFKEMKTITPVGRAGTIAAVAGGVTLLAPQSVRKYTKGVAVGMAAVTGTNLSRRGFTLYTDKDANAIMSGADDAMLGGIEDQLALGGDLSIEGAPGDDELAAMLNQMMAA